MSTKGIVFVVDDDVRIRESLQSLLVAADYDVRLYGDVESFLAESLPNVPCCIILDLNLGSVSGLEVQRRLSRDAASAVIFLTGCADIPSTVRAMKAGALDFLTKPVEEDELLLAVNNALYRATLRWERRKAEREIRRSYMTLTPRERDVLPFVVQGFLNKQTAYELGTSEITIRIHRGNIMRKMRADSLAHLVRLAGKLGIPQPQI
jgi:FixJ family two-component response regulator